MKAVKWLFLWFVFWCTSSIFLVQTWFVPDEYWQSLEIAHLHIFKYGYLTWEWHHGLRSYIFPLLFAIVYWLLDALSLDYVEFLVYSPRFVQAVIFAVGLLYTCRLSRNMFGCRSVPWTVVVLSTSWVLYYCASRTLYNTTETALTMIALFYYQWRNDGSSRTENTWKFLSIAAFSSVIRPTTLIIWVPLCVSHLLRFLKQKGFQQLLLPYLVISMIATVTQVSLDSAYYGKVTFTPYNFVRFNVLTNLSAHYGTHPWHWYVTQGLPILLTTHLIPFLLAVLKKPLNPLNAIILWMIVAYSLLGHKEFRFILPVVPLAACVIGDYMASLAHRSVQWKYIPCKPLTFIVSLLCLSNIPLAAYFGLVHQRGTNDAVSHLAQLSNADADMRVLFLMPCHSTPYYSHIHRNISLQFLTCEPNLDFVPDYEDEADQFYRQPIVWLSKQFHLEEWNLVPTATADIGATSNVPLMVDAKTNVGGESNHSVQQLPTHIVIFDVLFTQIEPFLSAFQYRICANFFHAHFSQGRVGKTVQIFCSPLALNVKLKDKDT